MARSLSLWQGLRSCGKPNCSKCPHGPYWYGRVLGVMRYFGLDEPYRMRRWEAEMSNSEKLKKCLREALDMIRTNACPCGSSGGRWIVVRYLEDTKEVGVEIECRACGRTGLAAVELDVSQGTKEVAG